MILNEKIEIHEKLNPLIWQEDNSLLPEVRESLFNVIEEFKKYCDIPLNIIDAFIVGSNASFNYTSYSDIDLHIIVNFELFNSSKEVLLALFNAEKSSFNKEYAIKIHGIDVELYVEDVNTSAVSNGIYSLFQDKWIKFPKKIKVVKEVNIDESSNKWSSYIESILDKDNIDLIDNAINTLYMIRKNSINVDGEYGAGNQLFKEIRNRGLLNKLKDKRVELLSKTLSLESLTEGFLFEDSRNQLISRGKSGQNYKDQSKGKNRFQRRTKSRISASVREYNSIDMNKFFKDNILDVNIVVQGETNKYEVKISFGNILDTLSREIERANTINPRIVIRALTSCFNNGNVYIHCSCLHPDTKIKLLDGTSPTVSELKNRFDSGETLYAYSVDEKGDFKPGKIEKVWITKTTSEFIKVTLDNNKEIITTPDHLYMLRDGTYKQAKDLIIGQSLMPLYFNEYQRGYDGIKLNSTGKYHAVYKLVADYFKSNEILEAKSRVRKADNMKYDVAIHHNDFNKHNNNPENLIPMTAREHWDYHAGIKSNLTDDGRRRLSESIKKTNANPTEAMIISRKEYFNKGRERNKRIKDRSTSEYEFQAEVMRKAMSNFYSNASEDELKEIADRRKATFIKNNSGKKISDKKKEWHRSRSAEEKTAFKLKLDRARVGKYINNILLDGLLPTPELADKYRVKYAPSWDKCFNSWDDLISYFELNHKVINIEYITIPNTPVYDIKVKDYPNFLVDAGVILHNCPDWRYRFDYYANINQLTSETKTDDPLNRPSKITNPNDKLGPGCKHVLLVLSNTSWIIKVASVINNYIKYIQEHYEKEYAEIIYPALYNKKYTDPVQLSLFDDDNLQSTSSDIEKSNEEGRVRGQFKKGNTQGVRFAPKNNEEDGQQELDFEEDEEV